MTPQNVLAWLKRTRFSLLQLTAVVVVVLAIGSVFAYVAIDDHTATPAISPTFTLFSTPNGAPLTDDVFDKLDTVMQKCGPALTEPFDERKILVTCTAAYNASGLSPEYCTKGVTGMIAKTAHYAHRDSLVIVHGPILRSAIINACHDTHGYNGAHVAGTLNDTIG